MVGKKYATTQTYKETAPLGFNNQIALCKFSISEKLPQELAENKFRGNMDALTQQKLCACKCHLCRE